MAVAALDDLDDPASGGGGGIGGLAGVVTAVGRDARDEGEERAGSLVEDQRRGTCVSAYSASGQNLTLDARV